MPNTTPSKGKHNMSKQEFEEAQRECEAISASLLRESLGRKAGKSFEKALEEYF
jgi:hypothetical protein